MTHQKSKKKIFQKLHIKNVKIGISNDLEIKVSLAAQPQLMVLLRGSQK